MKVRTAFLLLASLLAASAGPAGAAAPGTPPAAAKTLAVIPFYGPERMWQLYTPFVDYLRRATGEPWELKLYADHEGMVKGVCAGEVDVALLGPVPLGRVNRACGAAPFLVPLGQDGRPSYHAMLLTGDPAVRKVADLYGRKVGFFRGSTAAHVLPLRMLRDAGLGPGTFEPVMLESQDRIVTALLERKISGAGVKEALYRRFEQPPLRLLQTSDPLPNFAFCALPGRPEGQRARFTAALLGLHPRESEADARTVQGWDDEIRNGFTAPPADFLPSVLRLLDDSEVLLRESR